MEYSFRQIEKKWQAEWKAQQTYQVSNDSDKPKCYVLDMFPYPSGAGLHVGHPLGYIASDIYSRFKRLKGYNVLHPMGYDAFGLPAEQYAIEHGVHPAVSTETNIQNFRNQLDNIGFCFDWSREVRTCDPSYYKWTQWIFLQLFESYYNRATGKAESIASLVTIFEEKGNEGVVCPGEPGLQFSAADWKAYSYQRQQEILMNYRLAYCGYGEVNWCEALGTVLANDEVVNGVSERGGHPVVKKKLRQWYLRITEYADRLLEGLDRIEFSEAMKEMQTNWIGKSYGAEIDFAVKSEKGSVSSLRVYTTRPDTIFGVDFMVVAPELDIVEGLKSEGQAAAVEQYLDYVKSRSERERMAEKKITGVFTGSYAINPFDGREIPIWLSEYVLAGYGTGAIMAVPCGDDRDHRFAEHFSIPITNIIGAHYDGKEANPTKDAILENSGFLNGIGMREATEIVLKKLEEMGIGNRKVNYRMRDAAFSRQRYWGEPFPVKWQNGVAKALPASDLPLELPYVESYKPGPEGEGPLANIPEWIAAELETNTMPGYAGSSWYFLRYMDPKNDKEFCSRAASDYWGQVDLYIGGTEHAVGHLLYSRMWTKVLFDLGHIGFDEPYKKLVNQGMIQGVSEVIYRYSGLGETHNLIETKQNYLPYAHMVNGSPSVIQLPTQELIYFSADYIDQRSLSQFSTIHVPIDFVDKNLVDVESLYKYWNEDKRGVFVTKDGYFYKGAWYSFEYAEIEKREFKSVSVVEKMSKSKLNVVNPDYIVEKFGADTFRMYEMFLGPVEISKPWDTKGIEGVHRFLKKFWRLYVDENKGLNLTDEAPTAAELKVLHRTIRKIEEDTERFSFNTGVSGFMICVNELNELKCRKKAILLPLLVLLAPYAPHITEELWQLAGQAGSVLDAAFPEFKEEYVRESAKAYPVAINGKTRTEITIGLEASQAEVEEIVLANELVQKWLEGKAPKKIVYVKNRMINVVI